MCGARYELFEPLSFIILNVFIGVTGRSIYIDLTSSYTHSKLLNGYSKNILYNGQFLIIVGLIALSLGYILGHSTKILNLKYIDNLEWDKKRTSLISWLISIVAFIGIILFIHAMGISIDSFVDISKKRALFEDGHRVTLSYNGWLASLGSLAFALALILFLSMRKRLLSKWGFLLFLTGIVTLAFPVLTSVRGQLVNFMLTIFIIWYYLGSRKSKQKRLPKMKVALSIIMVVIIILVMTGMRASKNSEDVTDFVSLSSIAENIFGSGNFFGVAKTSVALEEIPKNVNYLYGESLIQWIVSPIPRSLWPEKPLSLDFRFGSEVYGQDFSNNSGGGRPPGFMVELYWNFGVVGVIVGMFFLGLFLAVLYRSFHPLLLMKNKTAVLLYSIFVLPLAMLLIGNDLSRTIVTILKSLVPTLLILWLIREKNKRV